MLFVLGHDELPTACGWFVGNGRCGIHSSLFVGLKDMKPETKVGFRAYVLLCVGLSKLVLGFFFRVRDL